MITQIDYPDTDHIVVSGVCGVHVSWPDGNKKHMEEDHSERFVENRCCRFLFCFNQKLKILTTQDMIEHLLVGVHTT